MLPEICKLANYSPYAFQNGVAYERLADRFFNDFASKFHLTLWIYVVNAVHICSERKANV